MELSKKDKKVAREIIEKGLQQEFANGLNQFQTVLTNWNDYKTDNRTTYHKLYDLVITFDRHIAQRYDKMSGSSYLFIIAGQLNDNIISETDLKELSNEAKRTVKIIAGIE